MNRMVIYLLLFGAIYWFIIRKDDKPALPPPPVSTTPPPQNNSGAGQDANSDLFSKIAGIVGSFFRGFTGGNDSQTQRN